jgi:hypothetical protein
MDFAEYSIFYVYLLRFIFLDNFVVFVCLFIAAKAVFNYLVIVTITGDRASSLGLCIALTSFRGEDSFTSHTYCDTGPRFIRSHPKDRHPRRTLGFELVTQGSADLCTAARTFRGKGILINIRLVFNSRHFTDKTT